MEWGGVEWGGVEWSGEGWGGSGWLGGDEMYEKGSDFSMAVLNFMKKAVILVGRC